MNDQEYVANKRRIFGPQYLDLSRDEALATADYFQQRGERELAASALDRAWGLDPENKAIAQRRRDLLDGLAVVEHGIRFCFIPAGLFLMGSDDGEPDERPVHAVATGAYWIAETPLSWAAYCELMGWEPPPKAMPEISKDDRMKSFQLSNENKIRLQYCETETLQARDWHAHLPSDEKWSSGETTEEIFGAVERANPQRPAAYDQKPMVAVAWRDAELLCERLSTTSVRYGLPTEIEWEKAARGALIGEPYSWGSESPNERLCDFDHFGEFRIRPPKSLPANGYGLFGMCGGVWEWTADIYDSRAYDPEAQPPETQEGLPRVLRGGSWTDCAEAVTVSFRMARNSMSWTEREKHANLERCRHMSPNLGFRLCRKMPVGG